MNRAYKILIWLGCSLTLFLFGCIMLGGGWGFLAGVGIAIYITSCFDLLFMAIKTK